MAGQRICSIEGCGKKHKALGWCAFHYAKWKRVGDPLKPKSGTPYGEPLRFMNEIVKSYGGNECLFWPYARRVGYGVVHIGGGKMESVHRIICEEINGPPPTLKHEVAHSCGQGRLGCVTPKHLRWATRVENREDMIAHGTRNYGERNGGAKLTKPQVLAIRATPRTISNRQIARNYGVSETTVHAILARKKWKSI